MNSEVNIGFLIYPNVTPLDAIGPAQMLSAVPNSRVHMIWKDLRPIPTDIGITLNPTTTLSECPDLDVLCVPGGFGQKALMDDQVVLDFLKRQGEQAQYVTSVCSGSLLLGAAGLLNGYQSACHWALIDELRSFGAEPVSSRVVRDRNRLSGGGVTAGVDFGLTLVAELVGEEFAKLVQLSTEYDPEPPFDAGSPSKAPPELVEKVQRRFAEMWGSS